MCHYSALVVTQQGDLLLRGMNATMNLQQATKGISEASGPLRSCVWMEAIAFSKSMGGYVLCGFPEAASLGEG